MRPKSFTVALALLALGGSVAIAHDVFRPTVSAQGAARSGGIPTRFFAGLTVEETAEALGISATTVKREWATAKLWLHHELGER